MVNHGMYSNNNRTYPRAWQAQDSLFSSLTFITRWALHMHKNEEICEPVSNNNISKMKWGEMLSLITHCWSWSPGKTWITGIAFFTLR